MNLVKSLVTRNPCYKNNLRAKELHDYGLDKRYWTFQCRGPQGGMLHSVGCAQPSAMVFINNHWNLETQDSVCVHAVIDANDGTVYQCLPWDYRGWHGGASSNNTHLGVEMCESKHIQYFLPGESGYSPGKFRILDKAKAQADCKRAYDTAVELFAVLAAMYKWNVDTDICSHKEGHSRGIASNHGDPEHYWNGLGMPYTMNGFRADVKKKMKGNDMTKEETQALINEAIKPLQTQVNNLVKTVNSISGMPEQVSQLTTAIGSITEAVQKLVNAPKELLDNDAGKWSAEARQKAIDNGVIAGVGDFPNGEPNYAWEAPVTREQLMTFFNRLGLLDKGDLNG